MNYYKTQPVIIIGMHRSGTTMLSKFLESYNIFMGSRLEQNGEAISFLKLNEKILKSRNSSWDDTEKLKKLSKKELENYSKIFFHEMNMHKHIKSYFGINNKKENLHNDFTWGWKDPRNTLTIDIIKEIFPNLRIIHIYRNPIDVANSLKKREEKFTKNGKLKWYYNVLKNYITRGIYIKRSEKLLSLDNGIKLWEKYMDEAFKNRENIIHIKYEDFLDNPELYFKKISLMLNHDYKVDKVESIIKDIDKSRKYSFIGDSNLTKKYFEIKENKLIKKLGYDKIL